MRTNASDLINQNTITTVWQKGKEEELISAGLTKREYFAALAMQGKIAEGPVTPEQAANYGIRVADALIAELNKAK